jgi:hypothetical protein
MTILPFNFKFYICGRYELEKIKDKNINYFIGFNHPGQKEPYTYDNVSAILGDVKYFVTHEVHDTFIESHRKTGYKMPDVNLINSIIESGVVIESLLKKGKNINLAVCCYAGISCSTAAAYIILCYLLGEWYEQDAKSLVLSRRDIAKPNPLMVKIADEQLACNWKMVAPWKNYLDFKEKE